MRPDLLLEQTGRQEIVRISRFRGELRQNEVVNANYKEVPRAIVTALDSLGLKVNVDISLISDEPILKSANEAVKGAAEEEQDWAGNVALSAGARAAQKKPRVFGPNRRSFQQKNQFRRPY